MFKLRMLIIGLLGLVGFMAMAGTASATATGIRNNTSLIVASATQLRLTAAGIVDLCDVTLTITAITGLIVIRSPLTKLGSVIAGRLGACSLPTTILLPTGLPGDGRAWDVAYGGFNLTTLRSTLRILAPQFQVNSLAPGLGICLFGGGAVDVISNQAAVRGFLTNYTSVTASGGGIPVPSTCTGTGGAGPTGTLSSVNAITLAPALSAQILF